MYFQFFFFFFAGYEPYFEEAAAEGTYPVKWTNIAVYGAAQCGKSGMVGLFLNRLPMFPDEEIVGSLPHDDGFGEDDKGYGSESDNQDPCTEVRVEEMENKDEVNEYRFYSHRVDPKYVWKIYDIDSLYLMLSARITHRLANPPPDPLSLYATWSTKEPRKKFPPPPPPPKLKLPEDSLDNVVEVSAKTVLDLLPIEDSLDGIDKTHWIYVGDCGNETIFLDIAPSLMFFFGINLCCYKIIDDLEQQVQFTYSVDGKPVLGRPCLPSMTNERLVREMFSGKVEVLHPRAIGVVTSDFSRKNYFSVVATFYDVYQALDKENNVKEPMTHKNEHLHHHLKTYAHVRIDMHSINGQVSFPFNTSARQKKDLKTVERFKRIANHCYMEVRFPIRWYLFFLQINEIKGSSRVMISLSECIKMAGLVGIHSVDVVKAALEYFHDLMLVLYFPTILPNVVFLSQKRIFDKLSEVLAVFVDVHTGTFNPNHVALLKKGILDRALLNSLSYGFVPNLFSPDDFLQLLEYLYVIRGIGNNRYYLPFLLEEKQDPHKDFASDSFEPLLFIWKKACIPVPTGMFLTLVHYLWRLEAPEFILGEDELANNYRNKVVFDCPAIQGKVILFNSNHFMGVTHTGDVKHCIFVRDTIMKAVVEVCKLMKWRSELEIPKLGFLCNLRKTCGVHVSVVNGTFEFVKCKERCKEVPKAVVRVLINDFTQLPWFIPIGKL